MPLPDNQFFEVTWKQDNRDGTDTDCKGMVMDWAAPKGATSYTVVLREDLRLRTVQTDILKVVGIVDLNKSPMRPVPIPVRQITLRN